MMQALLSYLRHVVVTLLTYLAAKGKLPGEGLDEAIVEVATFVVFTVSWAVVKFGGPFLKKIGWKDEA